MYAQRNIVARVERAGQPEPVRYLPWKSARVLEVSANNLAILFCLRSP